MAASDILARYRRVYDQVSFERGWRNFRSLPTQPYDGSFPKADIPMGGHVDQDPTTEDWVEVWSEKPEPSSGRNLIMRETFVQGSERNWFKKRNVLHHYATLIRSPGGTYLDAVVSTIDLDTGELVRSLNGDEAFDFGIKKNFQDPRVPRGHNPPPDRVGDPPRISPNQGRIPEGYGLAQREALTQQLDKVELSDQELKRLLELAPPGKKFDQGYALLSKVVEYRALGMTFAEALEKATGRESGLIDDKGVSFEEDGVWVGEQFLPDQKETIPSSAKP